MNKILRIASLSLGIMALATIAHADPINFASNKISIFNEHTQTGLLAHENGDHHFRVNWGREYFREINPQNVAANSWNSRGSPFGDFINAFDGSCTDTNPGSGGRNTVPDGANTVVLLGLSALGLAAMRRWLVS